MYGSATLTIDVSTRWRKAPSITAIATAHLCVLTGCGSAIASAVGAAMARGSHAYELCPERRNEPRETFERFHTSHNINRAKPASGYCGRCGTSQRFHVLSLSEEELTKHRASIRGRPARNARCEREHRYREHHRNWNR